ncbi:MAG: plastocyanin/azurin family copper-binding protein [Myxococcota bacterium]|nr:plastocyanin/azurin family copper-binding protein [Myxococcota bacterium]
MNARISLSIFAALAIACGESDPAPTAASAPTAAPEKAEAPAKEPAPTAGAAAAAEAPAADAAAEAPAADAAPAAAAAGGALTPDAEGIVRMTASDTMQYNGNRIEVEGTKVQIELKHIGSMDKAVMGHNLVVLTPGTDPMAWSGTVLTAVDTDFVPPGDKAVVAATKLLGGGESDTISFEVPGPGEYPFLCSFPGHVGMMKGVLVVK